MCVGVEPVPAPFVDAPADAAGTAKDDAAPFHFGMPLLLPLKLPRGLDRGDGPGLARGDAPGLARGEGRAAWLVWAAWLVSAGALKRTTIRSGVPSAELGAGGLDMSDMATVVGPETVGVGAVCVLLLSAAGQLCR